MRGLKQDHSARLVIAGHAFVQNLRRGHYELAVEEPMNRNSPTLEAFGTVRRVRRPSGEAISDDRHSACPVGTEQANIRSATAVYG
jgi:hypothetical protein